MSFTLHLCLITHQAQHTQNMETQTQTPKSAQQIPNQTQTTARNKSQFNTANVVSLQNSNYYKMRTLLKDLRPYFNEVLRTPNFQDCQAAEEIRGKMKLLMELYRQINGEAASSVKSINVPQGQPLRKEKQDTLPPQGHAFPKPPENKPVGTGIAPEKPRPKIYESRGTYIVGGSAFGWNFITYPGSEPVYYGRTKESFRSAQELLRRC